MDRLLPNNLAKALMEAIGLALPQSKLVASIAATRASTRTRCESSAGVLRGAMALAFLAASCGHEAVAPDSDQEEVREPDIWLVAATTVEALGGRAVIDLARISMGEIGIATVPARDLDPELAAAGPNPICSRSFDAGYFERVAFARCVRNASKNDVCGNGGSKFKLEVAKDAEEFHVHCPA